MTGQHDRQWNVLSGQVTITAGHCPLTGRSFKPWFTDTFCVNFDAEFRPMSRNFANSDFVLKLPIGQKA